MALLQVKNLTKKFGGLTAVKDVSFDVAPGEIVGLIGPNGAGKTTVFNWMTGIIPKDDGHIILDGREITGLPAYRRSLVGIGRTFQVVRPFEMTVLENVMAPALARTKNTTHARQKASAVLAMMGLDDLAHAAPGSLTLAQRKRIEVARALATNPKLLLLDEVLAGLNPTEVAQNLPLIRQVRDRGVTIIFIEHLMDAMMSVSERVLVMDQGALIATGTPAEVTNDECVIKAYLGEEAPQC
ncbi:MAG: ABC transporter ATP-binding protein [Desulfobacterales bacterium]|nr:MAG: ABC transporter ATP-binding protein [Desulfobacterales bacterium]